MNIKKECEKYLSHKYLYYIIGQPSISDYEFDIFEKDLRNTGNPLAIQVTDLVDFPSLIKISELGLNIKNIAPNYHKVKKDDTNYPHLYPMLSTKKIQVNDEDNFPYDELNLFFNKTKTPYYICEEKLDGNGLEIIYSNFKLKQILTRGDSVNGKDKTKKLSLLVPKSIKIDGDVSIRGELIIEEEKWKQKYSKIGNSKTGKNSRNFVGGIVTKETYIYEEITDLDFIAFSIVETKNGKEIYFDNEKQLLKDNGFNINHNLFSKKIKNIEEFEKTYFEFKDYRENKSKYKIDGFVLKYSESLRYNMGLSSSFPYWSCAIKFLSDVASTEILEIEWNISKTGEMSPVAILKPLEMDGRIIRRASLANLGNIIKRKLYPGCTTSIRLAGDIIAQCIDMVKPSLDEDKYIKEYEDFSKNS